MKRRTVWPFWTSLFVVLLGIAGGITLVATLAQPDGGVSSSDEESTSGPREEKGATAGTATRPKRMAIGGAPGYFVVVNPDGSSYMESPDGKRTQLADADPTAKTVSDDAVKGVVDRMAAPPKKTEIGQLVVCDKGVVDVPKGAVITYVGDDKVVTVNPVDGSSVVYFTDGKVTRRDRVERARQGSEALKKP